MKGPFMEYGHGDVGNGMSDPKPVDDNEFAEFMWMGEELDEFDQQVEQQLMEEFLIETCVEQMLRDEDTDETIPPDLHAALTVEMMRGPDGQPAIKPQDATDLASRMGDLNLASGSRLNPNAPVFTLNPNASVFVPRGPPSPAQPDDPAQKPPTGLPSAPTEKAEEGGPPESEVKAESQTQPESKVMTSEDEKLIPSDSTSSPSEATVNGADQSDPSS